MTHQEYLFPITVAECKLRGKGATPVYVGFDQVLVSASFQLI